VTHEVVNESATSVNPRLYLQLVRDGNAPEGESSFYFTFTGPAVYTDNEKFHKIDFKTIEKHRPGDKPDHATVADNGWVAMVQHYFAAAWLIDKPGAPGVARILHRQGRHQHLLGRHVRAGRRARAGREQDARCEALHRPAGRGQARADRARPRARQGLRLVHDPREAAVLAADPAAQADRQLGLGDRRPGRAAEDRVLLAQRDGRTGRWRR
jgi:hypothetical protein